MNKPYLISIVGPTGIGKTSLSIQLARAFNSEILSADSRQFFREMHIGTAAPSAEELSAARHHFIQHRSIQENYSVGDFERDALEKIEELFQTYRLLIMVGGSGLYVKSVLEGLDSFPEVDSAIRAALNDKVQQTGLIPLQEQLKNLDPETFEKIDINNPHRVIRALEICLGTGKPYSTFLQQGKSSRNFKALKIGLSAPREVIYDRINQRVDQMLKEGLLQEALGLFAQKDLNALNTVGYKELFEHFEGKTTLEEAVEEIKKNTRRFAKRQLTWFRKEEDIHWFDYTTPASEIISFIENEVKKDSSSI
ncbi:tRNA (adenosine(37)-N6)-dimethylallyltransferase MiaA [Antarcticibacterium arcticum]|uniref:tRNA dimethylallyltransferase n=1 Tax=Antarcticibacterium arcticum TaxID=2585771 RepID=A0A5B8YJ26_9FLAO|nr:tRNA (adenosine(37)-N6)-dimethylallyltransferase MiaA [Antarcticibacterium arcticum]QED36396.1 tRNA (adenosine(37)-N6)-dimethylallyltransferase MiaA [Antarcticibacterium arcticum]